MKSILIKFLLVSSLMIFGTASLLKSTIDVFTTDKRLIENDINSMLLGNYLRRLMLKVKIIITIRITN